MEFVIEKVLPNGLGRVGVIKTTHGEIKTPAFMAVGTRGYVRFISADDLHELGAQAMLSNGYHLRRQAAKIAKAGGLAEWKPLSFDQPFPFTEPAASRPVVTGETCFDRSPLVAKSSEQACRLFPVKAVTCPSISQVEEGVRSFIGEIEQTVPQYSAVKINGQRAYKLAREGRQVEMPRRKIQIYEIEILRYEWPELTIRCKVSSGTYIRTLGEDIGNKLGVGGYLTALRRTEVGEYRVDNAITLEEYLSHP